MMENRVYPKKHDVAWKIQASSFFLIMLFKALNH